MAGGIFVDQPFHLNPKCLVFGLLLMISYWWIPTRNVFMLPMIMVTSYIAMAWYDYMYQCESQLYSGTGIGLNTIDTWGKPMRRNEPSKPSDPPNLVKNQELAYLRNINLFHALYVGPLMILTAWLNGQYGSYVAMGGLAIWAIWYHGMRLGWPREGSNPETARAINVFHLLVIVPLLSYIGWRGTSVDPRAWSILGGIGVIACGYHLFRYWQRRDDNNSLT